MRQALLLLLTLLCVAPVSFANDQEEAAVAAVLDAFHAAAAAADRDRYLGLMTTDGVFLGTDEWERWPLAPDFRRYVTERFKGGTGWVYAPEDRTIAFSGDGTVAWFDEVAVSATAGRFRGTGVLLREADGWKIAHYALSFLVPNEHWDAVVALKQQAAEAAE